ncbi:expressed unknown protein [Seminavis robusta]|uniref:N-acetyltransferase domain-containing protein n=1 Tax=Seminavis robusta TaxID=568900 RepID=A0A9N8DPX5_9STRA|nr:expressed unknown protein [Seminavis robusta]|eukprot:Sro269_g103900.1 n/a (266) ;mRNA; r:10193-10990
MGSSRMRDDEKESEDDICIDVYDSDRDGEAVGLLWADGILEMFPPLYAETALHPTVVGGMVALEAVIIPLSSHIVTPRYRHVIMAVLPGLFLGVSCLAFLLVAALKIHIRWSKKTRIETTFGDAPQKSHHQSDTTTTNNNNNKQKKKEIIGQWVLLRKTQALGCVTLYREEDASDDGQGEWRFWISHLTIAPSIRRLGWGDRLASKAEAKAREMGASSIRILVGNVKSKPFWLQRGYKTLYPRWTWLGHESIYMELDLKEKEDQD